jgi:uncharacterized Fe-S cluster-containing radical SAM superfamily protein
MTEEFPRVVTPRSKPYDPLKLARATQRLVCRLEDSARKYTNIYLAGVYGGIATAYAVGCPIRCIFCWVDDSRDYPETRGRFFTPEALVNALLEVAKRKGTAKARISGAEPTLCKRHLLEVLPLIDTSSLDTFMLETNGILFGTDLDYVKQIAQFDKVHIRISIKAATPEGFEKRTGAKAETYLLPFRAIENLLEANASFHVAAMTDPRLMSRSERAQLIKMLTDFSPRLVRGLEEEVCDPYPATARRLEAAGVDTLAFFSENQPIY